MDASQKEQEFFHLFDTHVDELFSHCFESIPDDIQAQELVERTFKRAWDQITDGKRLGVSEFYRLLDELVDRRVSARGLSLPALVDYFSGNMKHSS